MTNPLPLLKIDSKTGAAVLTVKSSKGAFEVLIDLKDWPRVSRHSWFAEERAYRKTGAVYFISKIGKRTVQLHRFIMRAPRHRQVDFVDPSATLDCRRQNLRLATITQQARNRRKFAQMKAGRVDIFRWIKRNRLHEHTTILRGAIMASLPASTFRTDYKFSPDWVRVVKRICNFTLTQTIEARIWKFEKQTHIVT